MVLRNCLLLVSCSSSKYLIVQLGCQSCVRALYQSAEPCVTLTYRDRDIYTNDVLFYLISEFS